MVRRAQATCFIKGTQGTSTMTTGIFHSILACWSLACAADCAEPPALLFRVSFDQQTTNADVAAGEGRVQSQAAAENLQFAEV